MEIWLWFAIGILICIVITLSIKIRVLQKSADEIRRAFTEKLVVDTNTLIDIPSHDPKMLLLADAINTELRKLRAQRQRFKLGDAELKEAVTNIAHDLRTPLTAITGYLQLAEREDTNETVARYLSLIANRTDTIRLLTEELFKYSILTTQAQMRLEMTSVNTILEESLAAAYSLLTQHGIIPTIMISEMNVERTLDRSALSRIFENIISNAVKYSDGDFVVSLDDTGLISFSNHARALDTVSVGRIFDRFYTVENGKSSTGLGLAIAKLLTERMGGTIEATFTDQILTIKLLFSC